jgi:hypothetical protein
MINIGGNPLMTILAIVAALGGVGLYFVRSFRPELARDHDIFFSAIALVLRQALSTQAKRSPVNNIDDDPINPDYRVDIDPNREFAPRRAPRNNTTRQMRGSSPSQSRQTELRGDIEQERRSSSTSRNNENSSSRRPRRNPDAVIDIDEDDIRPVSPKQRRPRPESNFSEWSSDQQVDVSPRKRKRPTQNPDNIESDEQDW